MRHADEDYDSHLTLTARKCRSIIKKLFGCIASRRTAWRVVVERLFEVAIRVVFVMDDDNHSPTDARLPHFAFERLGLGSSVAKKPEILPGNSDLILESSCLGARLLDGVRFCPPLLHVDVRTMHGVTQKASFSYADITKPKGLSTENATAASVLIMTDLIITLIKVYATYFV
ncbi:hypothetical protein CEXT_245291 [Caerostris extrusa]|uniref:Uncharacterized protein n=1 Tax=Caerostris extrusa TaxID=172846 RepID=A0AAV4Q9I6_CAEEX|nr:hypothetical protein CEXT_245291 [Caerostris extrusa]